MPQDLFAIPASESIAKRQVLPVCHVQHILVHPLTNTVATGIRSIHENTVVVSSHPILGGLSLFVFFVQDVANGEQEDVVTEISPLEPS